MSDEILSIPLPTHKSFRNLIRPDPYGRLTVISYAGMTNNYKKKRQQWLCECLCGKRLIVIGDALTTGNTTSCGCWYIESITIRATKHGDNKGRGRSRENSSWHGMIQRCTNPNCKQWDDYGGRGIKVCERWLHSYANFLSDIGRRPTPFHTIERKNNDGNYEPGNCIWVTRKEQARNRRTTKFEEWNGEMKSVQAWAEQFGVSYEVLFMRLRCGWSMEKCATTPYKPRNKTN